MRNLVDSAVLLAFSVLVAVTAAGCPGGDEPAPGGGGDSGASPASKKPVEPPGPSQTSASAALAASGKSVALETDSAGRVVALSGFAAAPPGSPSDPGKRAVAFVEAHGAAFGLAPGDGLAVSIADAPKERKRGGVVRLDIHHQGVPILGAGFSVAIDGNGKVRTLSARVPKPPEVGVAPAALKPTPTSRLVIVVPDLLAPGLDGPAKLAWETRRDGEVGAASLEYTDALTGMPILAVPADDPQGDATPQAFVTCHGVGAACATKWFTEAGKVHEGEPHATIRRAHALAQKTAAYYAKTFKRKSWDGEGAPVKTHVLSMERSAFWRTSNGTTYVRPQRVYYDVLVHEFGHGVVRKHTPGLLNGGFGGAMNEAFADIFACGADGNWLIGEEIPNKPPLRDLRKRRAASEFVTVPLAQWTPKKGDGKTHFNGGIIGHAFYLMAEGCRGPGEGGADRDYCKRVGVGMGSAKTLQLAYKLVTELLTPTMDFDGLRGAAIAACRRFNAWPKKMSHRDCGVVINAFHAIGVGRPDTDLDGVVDGPDNCNDVYNPDQKPSKEDPDTGKACITSDGSRVISGDDGDHTVAKIETLSLVTKPMCGSAPTALIDVTTRHRVTILAGSKRSLQLQVDAANNADTTPGFANNPRAKVRGLNCIWADLKRSTGAFIAQGLSKDAAFVLETRLRRRAGGKLDVSKGVVEMPDHGKVIQMTAGKIWGKDGF